MATCTHADSILIREFSGPGRPVCEQCVARGDRWVHLRMCLTCGQVGCCDSSKNKHATAHFRDSGHPLMRSVEPGETWRWCYVDEVMLRQEELP